LVITGIDDDLLIAAIPGENEKFIAPLATPGLAQVNLQYLTRNSA
jgi:hypothetical protein